MPVFYTNCYGQVYVLHEGKTKTGKSRYYFSLKTDGPLAESIPNGYEAYERPGGMVYFRKIQKTPILPDELKYVQKKIASCVDQEDEKSYPQLQSSFGAHVPGFVSSGMSAFINKYCTRFEADIRGKEIIVYRVKGDGMPIMKFALIDESTREFIAYRWCFKGRIDGWIRIGSPGQLKMLVDRCCPALGTDNFYELM